jgi:hypothetical protein
VAPFCRFWLRHLSLGGHQDFYVKSVEKEKPLLRVDSQLIIYMCRGENSRLKIQL